MFGDITYAVLVCTSPNAELIQIKVVHREGVLDRSKSKWKSVSPAPPKCPYHFHLY